MGLSDVAVGMPPATTPFFTPFMIVLVGLFLVVSVLLYWLFLGFTRSFLGRGSFGSRLF